MMLVDDAYLKAIYRHVGFYESTLFKWDSIFN